MSEEKLDTKYYAKDAERFRTTVRVEGKKVVIRFDKHIYSTTDDKVVAALDAELARPGSVLPMHIQKINRQAAAEVVKRHMARKAAVKGGVTSFVAKALMEPSETQVAIQQLHSNGDETGLKLFTGQDTQIPPETESIDFSNPNNLHEVSKPEIPVVEVPKPTPFKLGGA